MNQPRSKEMTCAPRPGDGTAACNSASASASCGNSDGKGCQPSLSASRGQRTSWTNQPPSTLSHHRPSFRQRAGGYQNMAGNSTRLGASMTEVATERPTNCASDSCDPTASAQWRRKQESSGSQSGAIGYQSCQRRVRVRGRRTLLARLTDAVEERRHRESGEHVGGQHQRALRPAEAGAPRGQRQEHRQQPGGRCVNAEGVMIGQSWKRVSLEAGVSAQRV